MRKIGDVINLRFNKIFRGWKFNLEEKCPFHCHIRPVITEAGIKGYQCMTYKGYRWLDDGSYVICTDDGVMCYREEEIKRLFERV